MSEEIIEQINKDLALISDESGLSLKSSDGLSLRGDFSTLLRRIKHDNLTHELIVKAARIKNFEEIRPLKVLDATAGMGEDSFLLAACGFEVTLFEYDHIIAALLKDSIERAERDPKLAEIAGRMAVVEGDSIEYMRHIVRKAGIDAADYVYDVILLDPMFPERQKSGLIKKKFQLLQQLESPCSDEKDMLEAAIGAAGHKVIIKRPAKGPYLAGVKPDYSIEGKAVRYDCITCQAPR